ncbi:hypothetical protein [Mucilaginibacter sp.]|uniref:hypothetical protein n=1 Tax=Mucilaginibacter sp. TaxID=1882438 RepID=UPI003AFFD9AE
MPDLKEKNFKRDNESYTERQTWIKAGQTFVELYTVYGGGHVIPQQNFRFPRLMGKTFKSFDTPKQAVSFFGL